MDYLVTFGRQWDIQTKDDYDHAMRILDENEFRAEMCDDFSVWRKEKDEVARQRAAVKAQAREKGIII